MKILSPLHGFGLAALVPSLAWAQQQETAPAASQHFLSGATEWLAPHTAQLFEWLEQAGHEEMSPIGMFMAADWVVKAVMLSLLAASVLTWLIFMAKIMLLRWERGKLRRAYRKLDRQGSLDAAAKVFRKGRGVVGHMVQASLREIARSEQGADAKAGIKERIGSEIARIEAGAARRMARGSGFLANVGSTAPFIGLFGTVWGIMNSFIGIAESNTTNLAIVAPGIAEALLATAIGLVAAIPAVIFYNVLARDVTGYKQMLADAGSLVERTLSRDLDRQRLVNEVAANDVAGAAAELSEQVANRDKAIDMPSQSAAE